MVADFRQFYGLDIPIDDDEDFAVGRLSLLWEKLPRESRTMRRLAPEAEWGNAEYLLHSIEYSLRVLTWQNSKDAQRQKNVPKPLGTPAERAQRERAKQHALTNRAEIDRLLGITE